MVVSSPQPSSQLASVSDVVREPLAHASDATSVSSAQSARQKTTGMRLTLECAFPGNARTASTMLMLMRSIARIRVCMC